MQQLCVAGRRGGLHSGTFMTVHVHVLLINSTELHVQSVTGIKNARDLSPGSGPYVSVPSADVQAGVLIGTRRRSRGGARAPHRHRGAAGPARCAAETGRTLCVESRPKPGGRRGGSRGTDGQEREQQTGDPQDKLQI